MSIHDPFTKESSAKPSPLLATKLHPPRLPLKLIQRPQLFAKLDEWPNYKITLLASPAGFGKTTLVNSWLTERDLLSQAVWVSLDTSDNDPARFWRVIMTACKVTPEEHALPLFPSPAQSPLQSFPLEETLIPLLNSIADQTSHQLLILEDYHVITETSIHETLSFFLTHLPKKFHVVLITRVEPSHLFGKLRANGELNDIQTAELRFSLGESAAFLQQTLTIPLPAEALEALDSRLAGWTAGLRLLSLSLQRTSTLSEIEHIISTFRGSHRTIRDYLTTEVLQAQSKSIQDFLLRTSVLPRLNASLCEAVTGQKESALLLENCEQANLFLEALDGAGEWYRYHAVFAEAMQREARRQLGEDAFYALSFAASCWFAEHGLISEAIEAALQARASEHAATLIESYVQTARFPEQQEYHTLRRWLEQLPEAILTQHALLCFRYAMTLIFTRESQESALMLPEQFEVLLGIAEKQWRASDNFARLGEISAFRAFLFYHQGQQEQGIALAKQALAWLPKTETLWRGMSLSTLGIDALGKGLFNDADSIFQQIKALWQPGDNVQIIDGMMLVSGMICFEKGDLHQALWHFRELYKKHPSQEAHPMSQVAPLGIARVLYEWNDLETVEQMFQEISSPGKQFSELPQEIFQIPLEIGAALLQQARGERMVAIQSLTSILVRLRLLPEGISIILYQETLSWLVQLSITAGDSAGARYWLQDYSMRHEQLSLPAIPQDRQLTTSETLASSPLSPLANDVPRPDYPTLLPLFLKQRNLLQARLHLAMQEEEAALTILKKQLPLAQTAGHGRMVMQIQLLMAQAYAARQQLTEAHDCLRAALIQGYAGGYQRSFLDEGENLFHLLQDLLPHLQGQPLHDYTQKLLQIFTQTSSKPQIANISKQLDLSDPLSTQEQRVLRLLTSGLSNPEIAHELVVSVNTIRTQVQSIYRKLQVNNRHAAAERARTMHLFS